MAEKSPPNGPRSVPMGMMVIGSEMASFTIVGLIVDYAAGTMPWFTVGLTLFGCFAAFMQLFQMSKKFGKPAENAKGPP